MAKKIIPQTVADLKEALASIPDNTPVVLQDPDTNWTLKATWYFSKGDKVNEFVITGDYRDEMP